MIEGIIGAGLLIMGFFAGWLLSYGHYNVRGMRQKCVLGDIYRRQLKGDISSEEAQKEITEAKELFNLKI